MRKTKKNGLDEINEYKNIQLHLQRQQQQPQNEIMNATSTANVKLSKKFVEWSKRSTSHGFPNIFSSPTLGIRILWAICFIISASLCVFMVYRSVMDYLKYDVVTKTLLRNELPTFFPTVSICNINQFVTESASDLIKSIIKDEIYDGFDEPGLHSSSFLSSIEMANVIARSESKDPKYGDENRRKLGFDLKEIMYKCAYNEHPCSPNDFTWFYSFNNGNCFKFNSGFNSSGHLIPLRMSTIPGEYSGLSLVFFLIESKNKYSAAQTNGLRIFIHNSSFSPLSSEAIDVKPGTLTNIGIRRTFTYKYPYPYSECIDLSKFDSVLYRHFKKTNTTYRQRDCFDLCLQKLIIENCKCYYLDFARLFNATACIKLEQLICAADQYKSFMEQSIKKKCSLLCPLECESVTYDFSIYNSEFPTELLYNLFISDKEFVGKYFKNESDISYEKFKERAIALNVYYPQFSYTVITELRKIPIIDLFSNIGGTLGLFLGISFLSFIEIVELVIELLIYFKK